MKGINQIALDNIHASEREMERRAKIRIEGLKACTDRDLVAEIENRLSDNRPGQYRLLVMLKDAVQSV